MDSLTIPADWTVQPLGALCARPEYGLTETASRERIGPRFVRITDIQGGEVAWGTVPFCRCSDSDLDRHRIQRGDLLVARIGGTTGKTFLVRDCPEEAVFASYLIRVRPNRIHDRYLYYYCQSRGYWDHINAGKDERLKGGVNSSVLTQLPIVVPPPREQLAIADALEDIESAARISATMAKQLGALRAATIAKLFREGLRGESLQQTVIGDLPSSWRVTSLGAVCERMNYGTSQHCTTEAIGVPVLRIPNVVGGKINTTDLKFAMLPMTEMAKTELRVGDILFVRTNGNREYTGRCAVYSGTPPTARFASYLIRAGLTQDYEPDFVVGFLNTVGRDQIVSRANPAADGKFNVDTGILKSVMLPHPTREEQIEIMRIIRAIENAEDCARRKSTALSALFTTALNELVTGSVRLKAMEVTHA